MSVVELAAWVVLIAAGFWVSRKVGWVVVVVAVLWVTGVWR